MSVPSTLSTPSAPASPSLGLGLLAAALSGLLYFLSFPGVDLWPLAFIAWVPWLIALESMTPKRATWSGLVMGIVSGVAGFHWLLEMLETFSGFPTPLCALFMLIVCAYQGARFALFGFLYARGAQNGYVRGFVFVAAFAASELLWPMLFPFTFAASAVPLPILLQTADLGGQLAVALALLGPNWALARLILTALSLRKAGLPLGRPLFTANRGALVGGFGVLAISLVYGKLRLGQIDAALAQEDKIQVGLVQANMGLMEKRTNYEEGRRRHLTLTQKLRKEDKAELVIWAETSLAGAVEESEAYAYYERNLTRSLKVPTILGAVLVREVDDARGHVYFNSALIADKKGKIQGRYDKHFLLAFGEYLPFGETFPELYEISPRSGRFTPGTTLEPIPFGDHSIALIICYEDIVPNFVNRLMNTGNPELIVNMTNDAWFGDTIEPWQHFALSVFRAVEHRRYFVRSTNSGVSGFVDPAGRILAKTKTFEQASLAAPVSFRTERTLYQFLGNAPDWALSVIAIVLAFTRRFPWLRARAVTP